jgi:8-oxo-dGTP pyrophosphatase MutT (NUDIX family)
MERHFTATGFVVHEGRVALHWHRKLGMWLPAGGHIEPDEDPVQAVLREVREEFAVEAEVMPLAERVTYTGGPAQIEPPYTILVEDLPDPPHQHIDMIYVCRLLSGYPGRSHDGENPVHWHDMEQRRHGALERNGELVAIPTDVLALATEALRRAALVEAAAPA